jgi:hypothetical protein
MTVSKRRVEAWRDELRDADLAGRLRELARAVRVDHGRRDSRAGHTAASRDAGA